MSSVFKKITFVLLFITGSTFIADAKPLNTFSGNKNEFLKELYDFIAETNEEEATNLGRHPCIKKGRVVNPPVL